MMRCGRRAPDAGALTAAANSSISGPRSRRKRATATPVDMPALSHRQGGSAIMLIFHSERLDQRGRGGCPDLLEVPSGIHDISAVANGPFARARGDEMANWQDPRTTTD